ENGGRRGRPGASVSCQIGWGGRPYDVELVCGGREMDPHRGSCHAAAQDSMEGIRRQAVTDRVKQRGLEVSGTSPSGGKHPSGIAQWLETQSVACRSRWPRAASHASKLQNILVSA